MGVGVEVVELLKKRKREITLVSKDFVFLFWILFSTFFLLKTPANDDNCVREISGKCDNLFRHLVSHKQFKILFLFFSTSRQSPEGIS